jgi:hypothetical protein
MGYLPNTEGENKYLDGWANTWKWIGSSGLRVTIIIIELIKINWFVKEIIDSDII